MIADASAGACRRDDEEGRFRMKNRWATSAAVGLVPSLALLFLYSCSGGGDGKPGALPNASGSSTGTTSSAGASTRGSSSGSGGNSTGSSSSGSSDGSVGPVGDGGGPPLGTTVMIDASGAYSVTFKNPAWTFAGNLGAPATAIATKTGSDALGTYSETGFTYSASGSRNGRIRAYDNTPVVVFGESSSASVANTRNFPKLTTAPNVPYHLTYGPAFIDYSMSASSQPDSPYVFFDASSNAYIISGASHFMNQETEQVAGGGVVSGIQSNIPMLPAGFEVTTILVADPGINQAYADWGQALLSFTGKKPIDDSTPVLGKIGYWTDNTSAYYYKTETGKTYPTTLTDVRSYFEQQNGVPLAYMQLDSWWYPKGAAQDWAQGDAGEYLYEAAPALFANGLAAFQQTLGIPLLTHARWIDPSSPYRTQYQTSGNTVIDPAFWTMVANYLQPAGVVTYEQDWLSVNGIPITTNLTDQDAYLDNMASAMQTAGIDMQYCEPLAKHILQSTKYQNLTNSRVSDDGFARNRWRTYFYGSRLATAVGVLPWTDVFKSTDHDSTLISALSTGLFGASDAIGAADFASLKRAIRSDGVIIKPDVPLLLLDRSIVDEARGTAAASIAASYTKQTSGRFSYVFAFTDTANVTASFTPAELGHTGSVYVYDVNNDVGSAGSATQATTVSLATTSSTAYFVVAPVGPSGIAMLGERGKIAPLGKKRVSALTDEGTVTATLQFAAGEAAVTLQGYAPKAPTVTASSGMVGAVTYSATTQRFTVPVTPSGTSATITIAP
jgi:hypothetical protein